MDDEAFKTKTNDPPQHPLIRRPNFPPFLFDMMSLTSWLFEEVGDIRETPEQYLPMNESTKRRRASN